MFWADRIAGEIEARFGRNKSLIIRDEKTASGRIHVGSMRGVAIHAAVSESLTEGGIKNTFLFEINDMDPMDGFPVYLPEEFRQFMGLPLFRIPSPDGKAKNFADYFATEFKEVIVKTGFNPTFYNVSELYLSGKMDEVIREALLHAEDIRRIYREVSGSRKAHDWYPLSVICENCGKVGTTRVYAFDGEKVAYHCEPTMVTWATGCGHDGKVSPFGGNATLPFKVEWPAKWKVMGVEIEGAGKDHSTKGGSRDVANHISREVFNYEPPFDIPYEWFLIAGKKMSSSKGVGSSALEIADLMPPKIFRLALLSKDITQAFNFDPEGDTIPILFDLYDKLAENYWAGTKDDYARLFEFLHPVHQVPKPTFLPRFSQVAFIAQMPHLILFAEIEKLKGEPLTIEDQKEAKERADCALKWLHAYAPEKYVFNIQDTLPEVAKKLNEAQLEALSEVLIFLESTPAMPEGETLHLKLHEIKELTKITPAELFGALYLCFLGKSYGPKAGWFLSVLDRDFVITRLKEATTRN